MHWCSLGVALEQETILGLSGPGPKRLLAPSLIDFRGKTGIRALYQAIGIPKLFVLAIWGVEVHQKARGQSLDAAWGVEIWQYSCGGGEQNSHEIMDPKELSCRGK